MNDMQVELLEALKPFAEVVWGVDFRFEHDRFLLPLHFTTSMGRSISVAHFRKAMEVYKKVTESMAKKEKSSFAKWG